MKRNQYDLEQGKNLDFGDCSSSLMSGSHYRVDAPSLRPFQVRLNGALRHLIQLEMSLLFAVTIINSRSNSHGPNVYFGPVFLPCQKFRGCICWAPTLGAEGIRITQNSCTVAQSKVCEKQRHSYERETQSNCARTQV